MQMELTFAGERSTDHAQNLRRFLDTLDPLSKKAVLCGLGSVMKEPGKTVRYASTVVTREGDEVVFSSPHAKERRLLFRPDVKADHVRLRKAIEEFSTNVLAGIDKALADLAR